MSTVPSPSDETQPDNEQSSKEKVIGWRDAVSYLVGYFGGYALGLLIVKAYRDEVFRAKLLWTLATYLRRFNLMMGKITVRTEAAYYTMVQS